MVSAFTVAVGGLVPAVEVAVAQPVGYVFQCQQRPDDAPAEPVCECHGDEHEQRAAAE